MSHGQSILTRGLSPAGDLGFKLLTFGLGISSPVESTPRDISRGIFTRGPKKGQFEKKQIGSFPTEPQDRNPFAEWIVANAFTENEMLINPAHLVCIRMEAEWEFGIRLSGVAEEIMVTNLVLSRNMPKVKKVIGARLENEMRTSSQMRPRP